MLHKAAFKGTDWHLLGCGRAPPPPPNILDAPHNPTVNYKLTSFFLPLAAFIIIAALVTISAAGRGEVCVRGGGDLAGCRCHGCSFHPAAHSIRQIRGGLQPADNSRAH